MADTMVDRNGVKMFAMLKMMILIIDDIVKKFKDQFSALSH